MKAKLLGIALLLIVLWVILAIYVPEAFLKGSNIENLLRRIAMYGILGIGVSFVIITAGIDLSIGSVVCLSGCLLTILLQVVYEPFEGHEVTEINPVQQVIVVKDAPQGLQKGDILRYFGGRRASSTLVRLEAMEGAKLRFQNFGDDNDTDTRGTLAKVFKVWELGPAPSNVVIKGLHADLASRDQITFMSPTGGLERLVIAAAEPKGDNTLITLKGNPSKVSIDWYAMPLERKQRMPVPSALITVLAFALILGLLHGLLVTKIKLQPFVVTLCGLLFYRGISRWLVDDQTVGFGNEFDTSLGPLASGKFVLWTGSNGDDFGIPYPFFILLFVASLGAVFLNKTIYGRYMLALGRNEEAARFSGINTARTTIVAYVICTCMAGLGGILFAVDSNSVSPSSFGNFFELYAIAAAVLGGCSLRGGEGSILGVLIGTAVMQTLYNFIVLMRISDTLEFAIIGAVILVGVIADEMIKRAMARKRSTQG